MNRTLPFEDEYVFENRQSSRRIVEPRDYQQECESKCIDLLEAFRAVLAVMATGLGKTVVFARIAGHFLDRYPGKVLVIAHREELLEQAADKIQWVTGYEAAVEKADSFASMWPHRRVVVASIQTIHRERRLEGFDPNEYELVVVDEAHHAPANTYVKVLNYFKRNPRCRVLGVTATPDRADEMAMGRVFDEVGFEYHMLDGINNGWLVPIKQMFVNVAGLDFSNVRTMHGDLHEKDLARIMEEEQMVHRVVSPTLEYVGDRQNIVFAASVAQAERMCEVFNRHQSGSAEFICGDKSKTPDDRRKEILAAFARNEFQHLCNCSVLLEGFDEPSVSCVTMARPTKSRSLYTQCVGRATRTNVPDGLGTTAEDRLRQIAASVKPDMLVLDFVGNSGKHKLISTLDILGGNYEDDVVERARKKAEKKAAKGEQLDMLAELANAHEEEREFQARKRKEIIAKAASTARLVDPFDVLDITADREPGYHKGRKPSEKMLATLAKRGVPQGEIDRMSFWKAKALITELFARQDKGLCTYKQSLLLQKHGFDKDTSFTEASKIIDGIMKNKGQRPAPQPAPVAPVISSLDAINNMLAEANDEAPF